MKTGVSVRIATEGDQTAVVALFQEEVTGKKHDLAQLEDEWQTVFWDDRQHILTAVEDDGIIGALVMVVVPNCGHQGQPWAAVTNLLVGQVYQGQGVGQALLTEARRIAQDQLCYKIVLPHSICRHSREGDICAQWPKSHLGFSLALE